MTKHRRISFLAAILALAVVFGFSGYQATRSKAAAGTGSKDGVTATLTTGKDSYELNEEIDFDLLITSEEPKEFATKFSLSSYDSTTELTQEVTRLIPVSGEPAQGTADGLMTLGAKLQPGDGYHTVLWAVLMVVSGLGIAVVLFKSGWLKSARTMALILCLILAGSLLAPGLKIMAAEEEDNVLTVSASIKVDGEDQTLTAEITYAKIYTRADLEAQLAEVAWAFYLKKGQIQYDSQSMNTVLDKYHSGIWRLTEDVAPEYGNADTTIYSVCTDFAWKSYLEAFDYQMLDADSSLDFITTAIWMSANLMDPDTILFRWVKNKSDITAGQTYYTDPYNPTTKAPGNSTDAYGFTAADMITMAEAKANIIGENGELLRPGDVLIHHGHCMMYVGNGCVLHCAGNKYNTTTGNEAFEPAGAIRYETLEDFWLAEGANYGLSDSNPGDYVIMLRPLNSLVQTEDGDDDPANDLLIDGFTMKPATLSRMEYPGMAIDRTVSTSQYGSVVAGGELGVELKVSNFSNEEKYALKHGSPVGYEDLVITENIPEGAELVSGSILGGGKVSGSTITWTIDLSAGETAELGYKVKVNKQRGESITMPAGSVANIPTYPITVSVSGAKISSDITAKLEAFAETDPAGWRDNYNISRLAVGTEYMERIYKAVMGLDVDLPSLEEVTGKLFKFVEETQGPRSKWRFLTTDTGKVFELRSESEVEDAYKTFYDMLVPGFNGGTFFFVPEFIQGQEYNINEFHMNYFEPGDVLINVSINPKTEEVESYCVYLIVNEKCVIAIDSGLDNLVNKDQDANLCMWSSLSYNLCCVLRPTLAYDDINDKAYDKAKEPTYTDEEPKSDTEKNMYGLVPMNAENIQKFKDLIGYDWAAIAAAGKITNSQGQEVKFDNSWRNTTFAEYLYALLGLECTDVMKKDVTTMARLKQYVATADPEATGSNYYALITRKPSVEDGPTFAALMREYCGGVKLKTGNSEEWPDGLNANDLEPGDILYLTYYTEEMMPDGLKHRWYWTGIYLGDGKMLISQYEKVGSENVVEWVEWDFSADADGSRFQDLLINIPYEDGLKWEYVEMYRPADGYFDINNPDWNPNEEGWGPGPSVKEGTKALPASAKEALLKLTTEGWSQVYMNFPKEVYKAIGLDIDDYSGSGSVAGFLKAGGAADAGPFATLDVNTAANSTYFINTGTVTYDPIVAEMLVPGFYGGTKFTDFVTGYPRYSLDDLWEGDIIVFSLRNGDACYFTGVYLGKVDGKATFLMSRNATNVAEGWEKYALISFANDEEFQAYLQTCPQTPNKLKSGYDWELFFVLRPGQHYDFPEEEPTEPTEPDDDSWTSKTFEEGLAELYARIDAGKESFDDLKFNINMESAVNIYTFVDGAIGTEVAQELTAQLESGRTALGQSNFKIAAMDKNLFTKYNALGEGQPSEGEDAWHKMLVKSFYGGTYTDKGASWGDSHTISELNVGDILVLDDYNASDRFYLVAVYCGEGKFIVTVLKGSDSSQIFELKDFSSDADGFKAFLNTNTYAATARGWEFGFVLRLSNTASDPGTEPEPTEPEEPEVTLTFADLTAEGWSKTYFNFPTEVYAAVGKELPDYAEGKTPAQFCKLTDGVFVFNDAGTTDASDDTYSLNAETPLSCTTMASWMIKDFCGGPKLTGKTTDYTSFHLSDLQEGDILVFILRSANACYFTGVYLGKVDGKDTVLMSGMASSATARYELVQFADDTALQAYLEKCPKTVNKTATSEVENYPWDLFFALRPVLN